MYSIEEFISIAQKAFKLKNIFFITVDMAEKKFWSQLKK